MWLFRRRKDSELWPGTPLGVLFPDGSFRIDKNPNTEYGIIISNKFKLVFRMKTPMPVCEWRRDKGPFAQLIPTDERMWLMTGDPSERLSKTELQEVCKLVYLDASNRAMENSNRRRWALWWITFGGLGLVGLLRFANVVDVVRGWW